VPSASIDQVLQWPKAQLFFADRVSAGIVALAERAAADGALILFEPSSVGDEGLFQRMLKLTHVLKYSNDRLPELPLEIPSTTYLEVQTLGKGGLRYRARVGSMTFRQWIHCESYVVPSPLDTAGAGDWCTAGIMHMLSKGGLKQLRAATPSRIQTAMNFGQALASWNCGFEGARGGMYQATQSQFRKDVETILRARANVTVEVDAAAFDAAHPITGVCSSCRREDRRSVLKRLHAAS
jgi:fructokinase